MCVTHMSVMHIYNMNRINSNRLDQQARNLNIIGVCTPNNVAGCLINKRKSFNEDGIAQEKFLQNKKKKEIRSQ